MLVMVMVMEDNDDDERTEKERERRLRVEATESSNISTVYSVVSRNSSIPVNCLCL